MIGYRKAYYIVTSAIHFKLPGIYIYYIPYFYLSRLNTNNNIFLQATGWFVSHGGFNGVTESLGSGIPL